MKKIYLKTALLSDTIMILLALASIALLVGEVTGYLSSAELPLIQHIDLTIAGIFLIEFLFRFFHADDRRRFFKHHWWELFACVPISTYPPQALRSIRLLRLLPLIGSLRVVRFLVRLKLLLEASVKFTRQTYLLYITTVSGAVTLAGAMAFHHFEKAVNPEVHGFFDSFWWAMETVTTMGYGDIYPVTTGGRLVAMGLMIAGVGALGALVAVIDAYLLKSLYQLHQDRSSLIHKMIHKDQDQL